MGDLNFVFQISIILLALFLGSLIGLTLKSLEVSKKMAIIISLSVGLVVLIIMKIFESSQSLINILNNYNLLILMLMSVITLMLGLVMIHESKNNKNNKKMSILSFGFLPVLISSIILAMLFFTTRTSFNLSISSLLVCIISIAISLLVYFSLANGSSSNLSFLFLGKLSLFLGSVILLLSFLLPNILDGFNKHMGNIGIEFPLLLGACLVFFIALLLIGSFLVRRKNILMK
jgi:predicted transporter